MKIFSFCIVILFTLISPIQSQEKEIYGHPSWLILEYGRKAFNEREFGVALRYAREALEKQGRFFPEAEILIGDVFDAEGNKDLAVRQYEKALTMSKQLYILNDKYQILYKLAAIYADRDTAKYEKTLQQILEDDEMYRQAVRTDLGEKMISVLKNDGFNKLIVLYRLNSYHSLKAHSALGRLYYNQGNYTAAAIHFVFSVVTVFSRCIEENILHDPEYIFQDGAQLLRLTRRYEAVQEYLQESQVFWDLYLLGRTLDAMNADTDYIRTIWGMVGLYSGNERLAAEVNQALEDLQ